jgi:hypothetical protein
MKYTLFLACLLVFKVGYAIEQKPVGSNQNLAEQYRVLSSECDVVDGFRVMKLYKMDQFWKAVQDSISRSQSEINQLEDLVYSQRLEMANLKTSLQQAEGEKSSLTGAVNNMLFLGKPVSKATFIAGSSIALLVLLILVGILFMMYRVAYSNAHTIRLSNEELAKEFENYKHLAVEKQIKLSRELQNYRNRMAELKSA